MDQPWTGGPFSEPARQVLARHAARMVELLAWPTGSPPRWRHASAPWVITHGEPHAGNVMRAADGHLLVDWDTVALAPPERDLWMVAGDDGEAARMRARPATSSTRSPSTTSASRGTSRISRSTSTCFAHRTASTTTPCARVEFVQNCGSIRDRWTAFLD